jgi:hypothetical protein
MRTAELFGQNTKLIWLLHYRYLQPIYSSVSYGPEAGITELVGLGEEAKWLIIPITISTIVLLGID